MQCNMISHNMMDALYGEHDAAGRAQLEEHLAACASCRAEWDGLKGLQRDLGAWRLPELGWAAWSAPRPRKWLSALAAAATLILSIGASLGLARPVLTRDGSGIRLSFGSSTDSSLLMLQEQLAAQETRHQDQIRSLAARTPAAAAPVAGTDDAVRDELKRLVRESEARLEQRVASRLADWQERTEAQRRYDLARVAASLSYLEGQNGQHMARTTELVGYMLDASHKGQLR